MIKTFEEVRYLIRELTICTIFESSKSKLPSLWEHVDLPEKQEGEKGWGEKVTQSKFARAGRWCWNSIESKFWLAAANHLAY